MCLNPKSPEPEPVLVTSSIKLKQKRCKPIFVRLDSVPWSQQIDGTISSLLRIIVTSSMQPMNSLQTATRLQISIRKQVKLKQARSSYKFMAHTTPNCWGIYASTCSLAAVHKLLTLAQGSRWPQELELTNMHSLLHLGAGPCDRFNPAQKSLHI